MPNLTASPALALAILLLLAFGTGRVLIEQPAAPTPAIGGF